MILQPGDIAIDYAFARPDPAAMVAAGVKLVVRYISPTVTNRKNLTSIERDSLLNAGLSLLLVWENAQLDPLNGALLGASHGVRAGQQAHDLNYPANLPIIAAVDFDAQPGQFPKIIDYLRAFQLAAGYQVGPYGNANLITACHDAGVCAIGWQTVAWSHKIVSPWADCLQHATPVHPSVPPLGAVDDNTVLKPLRAWSLLPDPPPEPEHGPDPVGDDMIDIVRDAETNNDKYCVMPDGTLRPLSATELKARAIANSVDLGTPLTKAERDELGLYVDPPMATVDQTARDSADHANEAVTRIGTALSDIRIGGQRIADAGGQ